MALPKPVALPEPAMLPVLLLPNLMLPELLLTEPALAAFSDEDEQLMFVARLVQVEAGKRDCEGRLQEENKRRIESVGAAECTLLPFFKLPSQGWC